MSDDVKVCHVFGVLVAWCVDPVAARLNIYFIVYSTIEYRRPVVYGALVDLSWNVALRTDSIFAGVYVRRISLYRRAYFREH